MAKLIVYLPDGNTISHDITEDTTTIGRLADNGLQIEDGSVSSHHAEILLQGNAVILRDLGSTNGTTVNDENITECVLNDGDSVRFGNILASFSAEEEAEKTYADAGEQVILAATVSAKPVDFACTSPFPKVDAHADPVRKAALILAGVSLVLILVSLISTFTLMNVPEFPAP